LPGLLVGTSGTSGSRAGRGTRTAK
jgi:hypothetical protein